MPECSLAFASLQRGENRVTWSLNESDLELDETGVDLDGPLAVEITAFREGDNVEVRGEVNGRSRDTCSRCGTEVRWEIESEFRLFAMPASDEADEGESDDDALIVHDGLTLELGGPIRELVLLAVPMAPLCGEDCLGLCPSCGMNRNDGACGCGVPTGDPRWQVLNDVLKNKKTDTGSS
jgi:uncharacterized protein